MFVKIVPPLISTTLPISPQIYLSSRRGEGSSIATAPKVTKICRNREGKLARGIFVPTEDAAYMIIVQTGLISTELIKPDQ